jgi:hypothetical protein
MAQSVDARRVVARAHQQQNAHENGGEKSKASRLKARH